jgi:hypothetical protein
MPNAVAVYVQTVSDHAYGANKEAPRSTYAAYGPQKASTPCCPILQDALVDAARDERVRAASFFRQPDKVRAELNEPKKTGAARAILSLVRVYSVCGIRNIFVL